MLNTLSFKNFKTWQSAEIKFGKITGLFGTNSSGKSSLIQFLLLLKQTKEATDRSVSLELNGAYTALGAYKDMIFNHDDKLGLSWKLQFEQEKDLTLIDPSGRRTESFARGRDIAIESNLSPREIGQSLIF